MKNKIITPKVLIVENESLIASNMKESLTAFNFEITATATDYNSALNSVRVQRPDIILMDVQLGNGKDGIETVEKIHTIEKIPVIYVTSCTDDDTLNRAIRTNPISYLIKPFKEDELKSNILLGLYKNSKKRKRTNKFESVNIGYGYCYNYKENKLFFKKNPITLTKKELFLLRVLIEAENKVVSFKELEKTIWPVSKVSDSTLRTLIYRLRSKLEHNVIETIQKVGCRISIDIKKI